MESEGKHGKTSKHRRERNLIALTGATALAVIAVNIAISAFNSHREKHKKKG